MYALQRIIIYNLPDSCVALQWINDGDKGYCAANYP